MRICNDLGKSLYYALWTSKKAECIIENIVQFCYKKETEEGGRNTYNWNLFLGAFGVSLILHTFLEFLKFLQQAHSSFIIEKLQNCGERVNVNDKESKNYNKQNNKNHNNQSGSHYGDSEGDNVQAIAIEVLQKIKNIKMFLLFLLKLLPNVL